MLEDVSFTDPFQPGFCLPFAKEILLFGTAAPHLNVDEVVLCDSAVSFPVHVDACGWRRMCTLFGSSSDDQCRSLADFTKRLCSEPVRDHYLSAYVACRLIPLDKCPGVRPTCICEVVRRIVVRWRQTGEGEGMVGTSFGTWADVWILSERQ